MTLVRFLLLLLYVLSISSCSDKTSHFVIEGEVSDADKNVLYLEKRELNDIETIDSIVLDKSGKFKFKGLSLPYPEFYVLKLNNQVINLVIDSTETINVLVSRDNFATDYTIKGSIVNEKIKKLILAKYKADKAYGELQSKLLKNMLSENQYNMCIDTISKEYREVASSIILENFKSPAAYFALFQKVQNNLLFDPYSKIDSKIVTAVANAWDFYYPKSPRSENLKKIALGAMKIRKQNTLVSVRLDSLSSDKNDYLNIELPGIDYKKVSLNSLRGKVVILDFTLYQSKVSPHHNMKLNSIYDKYKDKVEIYQVSFDIDKHLWQNAALNIPWIAVYDNQSLNSPLVTKYNIQTLPVVYLIDKEGLVKNRIENIEDLEAEIIKLF